MAELSADCGSAGPVVPVYRWRIDKSGFFDLRLLLA
jgi:hypothetical protein